MVTSHHTLFRGIYAQIKGREMRVYENICGGIDILWILKTIFLGYPDK